MKAPLPWYPAPWDDDDALALKALEAGVASEGQQKRALAWIVNKAAMAGEQTFIPPDKCSDPNGRVDAFLEGRRSVGNQILKLVNVNLEKLKHV